MGIFDDAIRQHLDLKRRLGADESELKQLEDEAFGLPTRPGDPDFPQTGESAANGEAAQESPPADAPTETEPEPEPEKPATTEQADEPTPPVAEPGEEPAPHGDAVLADPEAEPEPPPGDEPPVIDEDAAGFTTSEREAIADQPTEFFDRAPEPLDLGELDLDLKDELEELEEEPVTGEEVVQEAPPADEATPVEAHEVVEEAEPTSEEAELASEPEPEGASEGDSEDVLEETPEFLRDNPDDDELWFEQGEPKDFDF